MYLNTSTFFPLTNLFGNIPVDAARPVVERDVFLLKLCDTTWCAVFRHGTSASVTTPGPTEVNNC